MGTYRQEYTGSTGDWYLSHVKGVSAYEWGENPSRTLFKPWAIRVGNFNK